MKHALALSVFALLLATFPQEGRSQVFDEAYNDDTSIELNFEVALRNNRMFRGQNLYNGTSIQPKARPTLNTNVGSFFFETFHHFSGSQGDAKSARGGTFEGTDPESEETVSVARVTPSFTEHDFDLGYELDLHYMFIEFGHRWYRYDEQFGRVHNTQEIHASADLNVIAHPYFELVYDWDVFKGWYFETGLRQPIPLDPDNKSSVVPFINLGFSNSLDGETNGIYEDNGATSVNFGVRGIFQVFDSISLQPDIQYNEEIDKYTNSEFSFGINFVGQFGI